MLFNSVNFAVFFPVVTTLYFLLPHRWRCPMLLAASCYFYMVFIPAYIWILVFTILVDYAAGLLIEKASGARRRLYLAASIFANVGVLFVFKYFNFFNANLALLARLIHWNYPLRALGIVLPIGLSFHTFQAMSYTIEVYYGRWPAERNPWVYALYVLFYPQLVAGPIERPYNLLPQLHAEHAFDWERVSKGLQLMLWGLFQKVVIADRLAAAVDRVYDHPGQYAGVAVLLATYAFAFQIYCDFAGYSDIARGAAQVMGMRLMVNFDRPYFAKSIQEFWHRWHISLSSWFRDYLYFPLGGSRVAPKRRWANLMIVFTVSGLWHGANWTYVAWGALHGAYLVLSLWTAERRRGAARALGLESRPGLMKVVNALVTFHLVCFAWIFFRAASIADAALLVRGLGAGLADVGRAAAWGSIRYLGLSPWDLWSGAAALAVLIGAHWLQRTGSVRARLAALPLWVRWPVWYAAIAATMFFGKFARKQFIYFQF